MILPAAELEFKISLICGTNRHQLDKISFIGRDKTFIELFALKPDNFLLYDEADNVLSGCKRKVLKHKHSTYTDFEVSFETYLPDCSFGVVTSTLNMSDAMIFHEYENGCYRVYIYKDMVCQVLQLLLAHLDGGIKTIRLDNETLNTAG